MAISVRDTMGTRDATSANRSLTRIRLRAIVFGLLLIPVCSFWVMRTEGVDYSGFPTCASLFYNVVFLLFFVTLANLLVHRLRPGLALRQAELLVVYGMMATGSSLAGHDLMQQLVSVLAYPFTTVNKPAWADHILPFLPIHMMMSDPTEVLAFHSGHTTFYTLKYLVPWIEPVLIWTSYLTAALLCMICINTLILPRWSREERLAFPVLQLPIELTSERQSLFRSRTMWIGFAVAAGVDLWLGLAFLYPQLPSINLKLNDISPYLNLPKTNGTTQWGNWVSFYPAMVGLSFFMPLELAFSCWVFFVLRKLTQFGLVLTGAAAGQDYFYPLFQEQAYGGWITLGIIALWRARESLKRSFCMAFYGATPMAVGDRRAFRLAWIGLAVGLAWIFGFGLRLGMSPAVVLAYFSLYFLLSLAITRVRAELGPPSHELGLMATSHMLVNLVGPATMGTANLAALALMWFQNRTYRGHVMPQQIETMRGVEMSGGSPRVAALALLIAAPVAAVCGFWAYLHFCHMRPTGAFGMSNSMGFAGETYGRLDIWLSSPQAIRPVWETISGIAIGSGIVLLLTALGSQIPGFPLHPTGYILAATWCLEYIWFPIFLAWLCKAVILRYAGLKGFRSAAPLFLGLILGEFIMGGFWSLMRAALGVSMYTFFY